MADDVKDSLWKYTAPAMASVLAMAMAGNLKPHKLKLLSLQFAVHL